MCRKAKPEAESRRYMSYKGAFIATKDLVLGQWMGDLLIKI